VRIVGVDKIPPVPLPRGRRRAKPVLTPLQRRTRRRRRALAARGMTEAVTWSFMSAPRPSAVRRRRPELALANPIAADIDVMRPSLSRPARRRAAQRRSRLRRSRRCSRSGRSIAATGPRIR
jgi:phenylalanyl-tRNA synthetase beta chain